MVSVDTSACDMIVSNPRRSIEEDKLLASNKIISDSIGKCIVKIRKADNNNILAFKLVTSSLPKIFSTWFTCGHSGIKNKKSKPKSIVKSDDVVIQDENGPDRPIGSLARPTIARPMGHRVSLK